MSRSSHDPGQLTLRRVVPWLHIGQNQVSCVANRVGTDSWSQSKTITLSYKHNSYHVMQMILHGGIGPVAVLAHALSPDKRDCKEGVRQLECHSSRHAGMYPS